MNFTPPISIFQRAASCSFVIMAIVAVLGLSSSSDQRGLVSMVADTIKKDTALAKKDTLPTVVVDSLAQKLQKAIAAAKDTTKKITGLQRDTTYRPDTIAKKEEPKIETKIKVARLSHVSVCQGVLINVPYSTDGPFNANNRFVLQMADVSGNFVTVLATESQNVFRTQTPLDRTGMIKVRITSTSPVLVSDTTYFNVLPPSHARIELTDGSFTTKIGPGQVANYRVNLTGAGPWSFTLSDSTVVANTFVNPYTATVAPAQTKSYKVTSVSNACGSGTTSGDVIVQVSQDTIPHLSLRAIPKEGLRVCTGTPFQINFLATGKYELGNGFVVQLSDSSGQFVNISDMAANSPMVTKVQPGFKAGRYKMRVVSTFPTLTSDTTDLVVSASASAVLQNDTLTTPEGKPAALTINFSGGGPWFMLLSDGSYQNDIKITPFQVKVNPYNSIGYKIVSAGGYCGVGDFSGTAYVKVQVPPTSISTGDLSGQTICAGTEIVVPFTSTGRFFAANKFIVQIADTSGEWVSLPTTGMANSLKAKINPVFFTDTLSVQKIRVISTAPAAEGSPTTIKVYQTNAAQARMVGGGLVRPGGAARLRITFKNGLPPWSFTLSDGTSVNGTFINPYQLTVNPRTTTEYKIQSLTNGCGTGTSASSAVVKVEGN